MNKLTQYILIYSVKRPHNFLHLTCVPRDNDDDDDDVVDQILCIRNKRNSMASLKQINARMRNREKCRRNENHARENIQIFDLDFSFHFSSLALYLLSDDFFFFIIRRNACLESSIEERSDSFSPYYSSACSLSTLSSCT